MTMSLIAMQDKLRFLVNSMFREEILDEQYHQLQMLEDDSSPGFVAEVITLFLEDSERILNELTRLLAQQVVDYQKVATFVHQLKGCSSSVGAKKVKLSCVHFRQFCEEKNYHQCLRALDIVKHEQSHIGSRFNMMLQLEMKIQAYHDNHPNC